MSENLSKSFRFKQFLVHQENCAMRVNTDGCLLAAWANPSGENLLDVGCGSGVISLMLAQRNPLAQIVALDIDAHSCRDAESNFEASPWGNRLQVSCGNFLEWSAERKFDSIISNPPFFSNGVKPPAQSRRVSRHSDMLPANEFLSKAYSHLSKIGRITVIVPASEFSHWENHARTLGLTIGRLCLVSPDDKKPVHRVMAEFGTGLERTEESLHIRDSRNDYSQPFIALMQDFYLHF